MVTKTVGGSEHGASDFAYVPDPSEPSTWKLPIFDARHAAAAVSAIGKGFRGKKAKIPAADLAGVKRKIASAYKKFFPDKDLPPILKSLDIKVNDQELDGSLYNAVISALSSFFKNQEWEDDYIDDCEEYVEEQLEEAGLIDPSEATEDEPVMKSLNEEKRQGTYVVLEPNKTDLQGDIYDAAEVAKGCHNFNTECRKAFLDHATETDQASIVESYIAPTDLNIDGNTVSKGTWLAVVQFNEELWKSAKDGKYSGLSIGAWAKTEEL
jgi:hypothetical protein